MSKGKLAKFTEMEQFSNVLQPPFEDVFKKDYLFKGKWHQEIFKNQNPIILELGCGKGEYTVGMASKFNNKNFIGIDIKGSRIWTGAKAAIELKLKNVRFLRTRIDFINSFFDTDEVDEIWFTFPDPQLKKPMKRLTSSRFLNYYKKFLKKGGTLNLKTDNEILYKYTGQIARFNNMNVIRQTDDLYHSELVDDILSIKTFYEKGFLEEGLKSHYIQFTLTYNGIIKEPPEEE